MSNRPSFECEWVTIPESPGYWIGAQKTDPKGRNYDPEAHYDETPRQVNLGAFRISKYPVTVSQYAAYVGEEESATPESWEEQQEHPNWPVVNVTWHQAAAFAAWAKARLPTEEEWERAARGPNCTRYPWGNEDIDPTRANYSESKIGHPTPVGLYPMGVSAEGAYDMIGNVWEWTASKYYSEGGENYVWRGGAFYYYRGWVRSSYRPILQPDVQLRNLGFRLAYA